MKNMIPLIKSMSFIGNAPRPIRCMLRGGLALKDVLLSKILRNGVSAYWANVLNFGDLVTPSLLRKFGCTPRYIDGLSGRDERALVSCGSILGWCREDFNGYVLGTGLMSGKEARPMRQAKILAVRGELTRDALGLPNDTICADPGLLADIWVRQNREIDKEYIIGLLPHQIDLGTPEVSELYSLLSDRTSGRVKLISSRQPPSVVAQEIVSCECILSSSLHGIIFADALGVRRARIKFQAQLDDFKFKDYFSSVAEKDFGAAQVKNIITLDQLLNITRLVNQEIICEKKMLLKKCFLKFFNEIGVNSKGVE